MKTIIFAVFCATLNCANGMTNTISEVRSRSQEEITRLRTTLIAECEFEIKKVAFKIAKGELSSIQKKFGLIILIQNILNYMY
ncbi:MAG: hypothetical protein IJ730_02750 [Alphaproteobacteria bacterium]|nr:hypothetical protein [Alphaproteobacteria bacterium]